MRLDRNEKKAYMSMAEFKGLREYSTTLPTGTTTGKVWKRRWFNRQTQTEEWSLGEYGEVVGSDILIHWYEICIETGIPCPEPTTGEAPATSLN